MEELVLDVGRFKTVPMDHQVDGVKHAVEVVTTALNDDPGTGKSKQAIDAACVLAEAGLVDTVVVVCPAGVRGTWVGEEFGQVKTHAWLNYRIGVFNGQAVKRGIKWQASGPHVVQLTFIITSYSFLRTRHSREELRDTYMLGRKVMLVCDEAHNLKNRAAQQSKAVRALRDNAEYVLLMTGTPYVNDITDLWHQIQVMNPSVYPFNYYAFRAMFAKVKKMTIGESSFTKVVGIQNKDKLDKIIAPFILRREKKDCLDLPAKVYSVLEVPLSSEAWRLYESMRDELMAVVGDDSSIASNAGVRVIRLQQLTSGFLGGIRPRNCSRCGRVEQDHLTDTLGGDPSCPEGFYIPVEPPREVDRSKLDAFLEWRDGQVGMVATWCRFRPEIERLERDLVAAGHRVALIWGGQSDRQREEAERVVNEGAVDDLVGQPQAGGVGLNLQKINTVAYLSNTFSLVDRIQSEDRFHRKGQLANKVSYTDFVCTSPVGRKTVDHVVIKSLREKKELSDFTMSDWRRLL